MKADVKKVVCALILAYFIIAMLWGCSPGRNACATYKGTYKTLYAKHKIKK